MQIFSFDKSRRLISAEYAKKGIDYYCRECNGTVRLRGGIHRKNHFFHLSPSRSCRQHKKSLTHLQVQTYLQRLLPKGQCELEKHFSPINRIADVVWEPCKIVYEVQCSPISKEEVENRNKDYFSIGYNIVWILHERCFNHWRVKSAELFLMQSPHYFTNINPLGKGVIYDQISVCHHGFRKTFKKIYGVSLVRACDSANVNVWKEKKELSQFLMSRLQTWPLYFENDVVDKWLRKDEVVLSSLRLLAAYERFFYLKALHALVGFLKIIWAVVVLKPYRSFFRLLLEKACK